MAFAAVTFLALAAAFILKGPIELENPFEKEESEEASQQEISSELPEEEASSGASQAEEEKHNIKIEKPAEIKAGGLKAGREFNADAATEEIKASIDSYIEYALSMELNSIYIDTVTIDGRLLYPSSQNESVSFSEDFSPISYAVDKAQENGLFTIVKYYATANNFGSSPKRIEAFGSSTLDNVTEDASYFAKNYYADAIAVDGYYYPKSEDTYEEYLKSGSFLSFEEYQEKVSEKYVSSVEKLFRENNSCTYFALATEPQWLSNKEDEKGSATVASFSCKSDGNADILEMSENITVDLILLDCYGSTEDTVVPFQNVISWWDNALSERDIPFIVLHYTSKAATEEVGWSQYDQISRQVIESRTMKAYEGSVFDSLARMKEDPKEFATKLLGYYGGSVKAEHIMTDLEIITPTKTKFTSFDKVIAFSGNTDPNTEATINGIDIKTDANGYFNLQLDLKEGENVFKVEHKGKTKVYNITRVVEVVRNVNPTGTLKVDGSTKLTITAEGYQDAELYAVVAGQKIPMVPDPDGTDETLRNTSYLRFKGTYTVPDATTTPQNLGSIEVFGTSKGITKSKKGADIIINARALPSDGRPVIVTADLAETFPGNTASAYSDPTCFPIPKGSLDYAVGNEIKYSVNDRGKVKTYSFYKLASGLRVLTDDIAAVSEKNAPVGNKISGVKVESDGRHTKVIVNTKQAVSYTASYSSSKITFKFHYTDSAPQGVYDLNKNPLFSRLTFKGSTMTLDLMNDGIFFGYTAYYENGQLILRFNNPPPSKGGSLKGTKIVIDPGHGAEDTGALGYLASHPEKVINWQIATYLEQELKDRGASVYKIPTINHNYSLKERVAITEDYDPHIFISIHNNSLLYNQTTTGTEAYYFNPFSYAFSQYTAGNVAQALGTQNRGGKFGYYYVTRSMQYPSILVEGGFMTNPTEYNKLVTPAYQKKMASAIANSISSYFSLMSKNVPDRSGTQVIGSMSAEDTVPAPSPAPAPETPENPSESESAPNEEAKPEGNGAEGVESENVVLSHLEMNLKAGEREVLSVENEDESQEVLWDIDKEGVAKFYAESSSPRRLTVEGVKPGVVTVTAHYKGDKSTKAVCKIIVE